MNNCKVINKVNAEKIAIFLPTLNGGGAERVMVTLANALAARGYAVDLVLASAKGPYLQDVTANVRVVDLKAGRVIKALLPLVRYLRQERPTAMLSAMNHANVVAIMARMFARVSVRLVVSERSTISVSSELESGISARILYSLVALLYPKADAICVVSQAALIDLAQFIKLPIDRIVAIYNPFNLAYIASKATEAPDHSWFNNDTAPVILAVGRLNVAKNLPVLIDAFYKLRQSHNNARLLILGEGELRTTLEAQITRLGLTADAVQMPGFVANPFAYLARCRLFVLSSIFEGLPGVLIEALACGAPVVSTDCPSGPHEILEGGKWGRLVPVGDVDALAQAMAEVLDTPRAQLPDGKIRAQDFEQERAVDGYLQLLLPH